MKKGRTIVIILFAVLSAALLLYFIFGTDDQKRYQWHESYRANSDQPYGTLFIKKMLEGYRPAGTFIFNEKTTLKDLLDTTTKETDYIFIGQSLFLTAADASALIQFMYSGNNVFIATLDPPEAILDAIYFEECNTSIAFQYSNLDTVTLNFYHDSLRSENGFEYAFRFSGEDRPYAWSYIDNAAFCDSTKSLIPLGFQENDNVNFIKISAGKGSLFLHTNPLVFTNYFLTKPEKVDYASGIFSHLTGSNIIWDEFSKVPFTGNNNAYNSPLYYILQQPSLKYAWWLLLVTILLYTLFAAKRQQRIIPVLEAKTNTSLEYVNLIATLHYQNGNHLDMARKKMKYFLYFVRSRYGIHAETFKAQHIKKLAEKSRVHLTDVENIFEQYYIIEEKFKHTIEANRLLSLYSAIERFYNQCK